MDDQWFVATDAHGVEHTRSGHVAWPLPGDDGEPGEPAHGPVVLRSPAALLDVLDRWIFRAEAVTGAHPEADGTCRASSARLLARTAWDTEPATRFALDCADHVLAGAGILHLPDGTPLLEVLADARRAFERTASDVPERLGLLARIAVLLRLRHERREVADLLIGLAIEDNARHIDAFEDPDYAAVRPAADALLAAIEALRHHLLPHLYLEFEDAAEEAEEHVAEDRPDAEPLVTSVVTPLGGFELHAMPVLPYDPAWTGAREAARHARDAAEDRGGPTARAAELAWQADTLAAIIAGP